MIPPYILPQFYCSSSHLKVVLLLRLKTCCHPLEAYSGSSHLDVTYLEAIRLLRQKAVGPLLASVSGPSAAGLILDLFCA